MLIVGGNQSAGGYNVDNSLRFDDGSSDYLYRIGGAATDGKKFTYSAWFKRGEISSGNELFNIYSDNTNRLFLRNNGDTFELNLLSDFGSTTEEFRDPSAWYHFVIACDSTQVTASDRGKWYLNGELIFTGTVALDQVWPHGQSTPYFTIGNGRFNNAFYTQYWDGYQSEVCFIDGQQLDPTSFGEFDEDTGIWKPIDVSGLTFGNNGFYLPFKNSAALGQDDSGNGNNFTVVNLTSIDQTTDTPTNNYATLNPLGHIQQGTLSEGNLKVTSSSAYKIAPSTIAVSSGKWYAEHKITGSTPDAMVGVIDVQDYQTESTINYAGDTTNSVGYYKDGRKFINNSASSYGASYTENDIIGIALDLDSGTKTITFYKNGSSQGSINLPTGGIEEFYFLPSPYNATIEINFGSPTFTISSGNSDGNGMGNFEYAVPSGYYALNSKNLAEYG